MNETLKGADYENLLGGNDVAVLTRNEAIASDTAIERGSLLALANGKLRLATAADTAGAELFIAAEDASGTTVATVYESGRFNRGGIKTDADVTKFEAELRRQGIYLTEAI